MTRPPLSPGSHPFLCPLQAPGAGVLRAILSSPHLRPWQGSSQAGKAVPFPACPPPPACFGRSVPSQAFGRLGSLPDGGTHSLCLADPTRHNLPPQQPPLAAYQHQDPNPSTSSVACHMPCLSVSAESSVTGKQTHLTLKQRRFEPCGSTYTRVFFSSEHYGTPGSAVGGGTEDVEGQL